MGGRIWMQFAAARTGSRFLPSVMERRKGTKRDVKEGAAVRCQAAALILAGGKSSRMGCCKATLPLSQTTFIEYQVALLASVFQQVIVSTNTPEDLPPLENVEFVPDRWTGAPPCAMRGLHGGLFASAFPQVFVIPADQPLLSKPLLASMYRSLGGEEALLPLFQKRVYPLHGFYRRNILGKVEDHLRREEYGLTALCRTLSVQYYPEEQIRLYDPNGVCLKGANTPKEYQELLRMSEALRRVGGMRP